MSRNRANSIELMGDVYSALEKAEMLASHPPAKENRHTPRENYNYELPTTSTFYRNVISPICDRIVNNLLPDWISPDCLTILGLSFSVLSPLALPFSPLLALAGWLSYGLCDNMDGKQARRLKKSSIRGEFLDHFADAIASTTLVYVISYGFLREFPHTHYAIFLACQVPFLLGCWYYHCSGKILLGNQTAVGCQITVDEINFILVPILMIMNTIIKSDEAFASIKTYTFWIAMILSTGCLIEDIRVITQIGKFENLLHHTQFKIGFCALVYLLTICLVTGCSEPVKTLPIFAWLCSSLIFPQCAKKAGVQPTFLQGDCVCPVLAGTILSACYLSNWLWVGLISNGVILGIFGYILVTQLRALPGSD